MKLNRHTKQLLVQYLLNARTADNNYLKCVPRVLFLSNAFLSTFRYQFNPCQLRMRVGRTQTSFHFNNPTYGRSFNFRLNSPQLHNLVAFLNPLHFCVQLGVESHVSDCFEVVPKVRGTVSMRYVGSGARLPEVITRYWLRLNKLDLCARTFGAIDRRIYRNKVFDELTVREVGNNFVVKSILRQPTVALRLKFSNNFRFYDRNPEVLGSRFWNQSVHRCRLCFYNVDTHAYGVLLIQFIINLCSKLQLIEVAHEEADLSGNTGLLIKESIHGRCDKVDQQMMLAAERKGVEVKFVHEFDD